MAKVSLRNLRKEFGDTVAVHDVPLTVRDGELLALLGPSGCGKSTTLRLIAGLEYPTEGSIVLGDRDISDIAPHKRDIAMVFQDLALYPHKTVRKNMGFGLQMRGVAEDEISQRVEEAAELLQISELLDRSPRTLSGGQQQRVAIGRAIVRDPEAFLFDEPLSDLDAKLRSILRTEILELHQKLESTMIYVTHDQEEAMTLGDRIAVMNSGEIHQVGEPDVVYSRPTNLFVARFIGNPDMNLFEGRLHSTDRGLTVETDPLEFTLDRRPESVSEGPVTVGIRPESFHNPDYIADQGGRKATIEAEVDLVEKLGDHVIIHVNRNGVEFTLSFDETTAEVGDRIKAVVDIPKLHYFDADTGDRIAAMDALHDPVELST